MYSLESFSKCLFLFNADSSVYGDYKKETGYDDDDYDKDETKELHDEDDVFNFYENQKHLKSI